MAQAAFARHAGLARTYLGSLERGQANPTLGTVMTYLEAVDVQPWDLMRAMAPETAALKAQHAGESPRPKPKRGATYNELFGAAVLHGRQRLGLSQEQFSLRSGVSRAHLSVLENGVGNPTYTVMLRIIAALEEQPWSFFRAIPLHPKSQQTLHDRTAQARAREAQRSERARAAVAAGLPFPGARPPATQPRRAAAPRRPRAT